MALSTANFALLSEDDGIIIIVPSSSDAIDQRLVLIFIPEVSFIFIFALAGDGEEGDNVRLLGLGMFMFMLRPGRNGIGTILGEAEKGIDIGRDMADGGVWRLCEPSR
mmetsp:Transcript_22275/g.27301  ORF Transcript_22275/g.27301 Transcript_22275/m.27301 type:complete len:108 (+) Transcript_22275:653-976(+)